MNCPTVSVIVPMFNAQLYIQETVESILASDYPNIEVVLLDDDSKDNTPIIAKKLASEHTNIVYKHQPNGGVSVARNHAIAIAKGEYILPVDADDIIAPHYISAAVEVLEQSPQVKVVSCKAEFMGERTGEWKLPKFNISLLARRNIVHIASMFRKTDFLITGGFDTTIKGREDWDFWINMMKRGGELITLPNIGLYYRIHNTSKRRSTKHLKNQDVDIINRKHKAFIYEQLYGPMHYKRSFSKFINRLNGISVQEEFCNYTNSYEIKELIYHIPELIKENGSNHLFPVASNQYIVSLNCATKHYSKENEMQQFKKIEKQISLPYELMGYYRLKRLGKEKVHSLLIEFKSNTQANTISEALKLNNRECIIKKLAHYVATLHRLNLEIIEFKNSLAYCITNSEAYFTLINVDACVFNNHPKLNVQEIAKQLELEKHEVSLFTRFYQE